MYTGRDVEVMLKAAHDRAYRLGWNMAVEHAAQLVDATKTAGGAGAILIEVAAEIRSLEQIEPSTISLGKGS